VTADRPQSTTIVIGPNVDDATVIMSCGSPVGIGHDRYDRAQRPGVAAWLRNRNEPPAIAGGSFQAYSSIIVC
jgi:hypothetical protein